MEDSSRPQIQDREDVQGAERGRDHDEEVARDNHLGVIADEG
jgi:hypothetical protein